MRAELRIWEREGSFERNMSLKEKRFFLNKGILTSFYVK